MLCRSLIEALATRFAVTVEEVNPVRETVTFKLPRQLVGGAEVGSA